MDNRQPIARRTPLRARREEPRRAPQRVDHGPGWQATREVIYARSGGRCERCGDPLHGRMEGHHRLVRRHGPDCPCNALALCSTCHTLVHAHPSEARAAGHIVSRYATGDPGHHPVLIARPSGLEDVWLTCAGDYAPEGP